MIAACVVVAVVCVSALVGLRWRLDASVPTVEVAAAGVLESKLRQTVLVTLKSGEAFRGVLFEHDAVSLLLRNVQLMSAATQTVTAVDGELVVLWENVSYVQHT